MLIHPKNKREMDTVSVKFFLFLGCDELTLQKYLEVLLKEIEGFTYLTKGFTVF